MMIMWIVIGRMRVLAVVYMLLLLITRFTFVIIILLPSSLFVSLRWWMLFIAICKCGLLTKFLFSIFVQIMIENWFWSEKIFSVKFAVIVVIIIITITIVIGIETRTTSIVESIVHIWVLSIRSNIQWFPCITMELEPSSSMYWYRFQISICW